MTRTRGRTRWPLPRLEFVPPSQSPGSQTRNWSQSCIVCLVPFAYSTVVCRSPERAAASAAICRRSGVLSPSTRRETLSSWLFMLVRFGHYATSFHQI
eukprot:scaffold71283_cov90-Phaeocystis_antarctica.AAC.1